MVVAFHEKSEGQSAPQWLPLSALCTLGTELQTQNGFDFPTGDIRVALQHAADLQKVV